MTIFNEYSSKPKVDVIEGLTPFVLISKEALVKMKLYIDEVDDEVGWLGTAFRQGRNIYIQDVFLFDQEVHATTTEITPEGLSSFAEEILQREDGIDLWNNLKVWGHSHVNMGVNPSGQDDDQMLVFKDSGHDWFLRIIANKKGAFKVDIFDYEIGVEYRDVPFYEHVTDTEKEIMDTIEELNARLQRIDEVMVKVYEEDVKKAVKDKVKKKSYSYNKSSNVVNYPMGYHGYSYWDYDKYQETKDDVKEYERDDQEVLTIDMQKEENELNGIEEWWFMAELAYCKNTDEMRELIADWGFYDCYTMPELREMMSKADDMANQKYAKGGWIE